jgi:hypothetical protein
MFKTIEKRFSAFFDLFKQYIARGRTISKSHIYAMQEALEGLQAAFKVTSLGVWPVLYASSFWIHRSSAA